MQSSNHQHPFGTCESQYLSFSRCYSVLLLSLHQHHQLCPLWQLNYCCTQPIRIHYLTLLVAMSGCSTLWYTPVVRNKARPMRPLKRPPAAVQSGTDSILSFCLAGLQLRSSDDTYLTCDWHPVLTKPLIQATSESTLTMTHMLGGVGPRKDSATGFMSHCRPKV